MEQELQKEQKCSFYALEQLRQTAEAILRGSQRLLKCRAGVEKYRTAQPQRAYAYYLELQKTRDALVAELGDAQRNLLELEESALAQKAGQLQVGLRRFDLMSRAYKPVYEVLTGFAKALPQTDTVNAAVIGRLMNHVRMGYYPTDPENISHILRGIAFPEGVTTNLLDPCCGCGKALRQLANGNNCYTYGMELDEHRAEEAQTRLHRVGFGSFFHSQDQPRGVPCAVSESAVSVRSNRGRQPGTQRKAVSGAEHPDAHAGRPAHLHRAVLSPDAGHL